MSYINQDFKLKRRRRGPANEAPGCLQYRHRRRCGGAGEFEIRHRHFCMNDVLIGDVTKLQKRYRNGYSSEASKNRQE